MGNTPIYNWVYPDPWQDTSEILDAPRNNYTGIENQLFHVYDIFYNGVLDDNPINPSWHIVRNGSDTNTVLITSGHGHVAHKYAETTVSRTVTLTRPASGINPVRYWIYAEPTDDISWTKDVRFFASFVELDQPDVFVCLGSVIVTTTSNGTTIDCKNEESYGRIEISLFASLAKIVNAHKHIGGSRNPSPIDLARHVQGKLSGDNIEDVDLSTVTSGLLNPDRLNPFDHNKLINRGNLMHPEIESELSVIRSLGDFRLSDLMIANYLQIAIGIKKQSEVDSTLAGLYNIDQNLINAFVYWPSSGSESLEGNGDVPNGSLSLATIDRTVHQIIGVEATPLNTGFITWNTDFDFSSEKTRGETAINAPSPLPTNVVVVGSGVNGSLTLDRPVNYQAVTKLTLTDWKWGTTLTDKAGLQTISPPSGVTNNHFVENINGASENQGLRRYFYLRFDEARSWVDQQRLGFAFSATGTPGSLFFFLILDSGGTAVSVQPPAGERVTLNVSTPVEIKTQAEMDDITARYVNLSLVGLVADAAQLNQNVRGIGFYYQTASGWDTGAVDLSLAVPTPDQINDVRVNQARTTGSTADLTVAMFVWNNNLYPSAGQMVFRFFGNSNQARYNAVSFDSDQPGLLSIKTRAAATEAGLAGKEFLPLQPGNIIAGSSSQGQWIDILVTLRSNIARTLSPLLQRISLSYSAPWVSATTVWDTQEQWNRGRTFQGITVSSGGDVSITTATLSRVGRWAFLLGNGAFYAQTGEAKQQYQNGSSLYKSPVQVFSGTGGVGFRTPRDIQSLSNGNVIVVDTENDRVVELTQAGDFVRGIQGNLRLRRKARDFAVLTAYYNPRSGKLYVCFSQNVKIDKPELITLVSGQQTIAFNAMGANAVLHAPLNGKSATIEVDFSSALMQQISAFTSPMNVLIVGPSNGSAGAVSSVSVSTDGTPGNPDSTGSGGGTSTLPNGSSLPDYVKTPIPLYGIYGIGDLISGTAGTSGGFAAVVGLPLVATSDSDSGDFNGDGQVVSNTLYGPGGQVGTLTVPVTVGEIVMDNLFEPISVQYHASSSLLIVGAVGSDSAICFNANSERVWSIGSALAPMREALGGSAWELENSPIGLTLVATPTPDTVGATGGAVYLFARKQDNKLIAKLAVNGDAVRAESTLDGLNYWVLIDDRTGNGSRSRLVRMNSAGRKDFEWGNQQDVSFLHPAGLRLLENDTVLISQ